MVKISYPPTNIGSDSGKKKYGSSRWRILFQNLRHSFPKCSRQQWRFFVLFSVSFYLVYTFLMRLYPEIDMVIHSYCQHPIQFWDGKLFTIQIWTDYLNSRPQSASLHNALNFQDILVPAPLISHQKGKFSSPFRGSRAYDRPLVAFGTHHKTGTYMARKWFARTCARLKLCCMFHLTRDSLYSLHNSLSNDSIDVIGHNQWAWYPYEMNYSTNPLVTSSSPPFRRKIFFVHFYRHPFQKIISSYFYHADAEEKWTARPLHFHHICPKIEEILLDTNLFSILKDEKDLIAVEEKTKRCIRKFLYHIPASEGRESAIKRMQKSGCRINYSDVAVIPRERAFGLCSSTHLCENCCRKEHESSFTQNPYSSFPKNPKGSQQSYYIRPLQEYQFLCQYFGNKIHSNETISSALKSMSFSDGLILESALNFYENMRMAKIFNYTAEMNNYGSPKATEGSLESDFYSLNVDLDDSSSDYDGTLQKVLSHVSFLYESRGIDISSALSDLQFYNLKHSSLYRWSMSNPFNRHVTDSKFKENSNRADQKSINHMPFHKFDNLPFHERRKVDRKELYRFLSTHPVVSRIYDPILSLMSGI